MPILADGYTLSTADLTFNVADLIGADFDARRTKVWIEANVPTIIEHTGRVIHLGDAKATVNDDGTGSFTGLITTDSTDVNPTGFLYRVHVDYAERTTGARKTWDTGWFPLTATSDVALVAAVENAPPPIADVDSALAAELGDPGSLSAVAIRSTIGRGTANGVAPLDANSLVPDANLPANLARKGTLRKHLSEFGAVGDGVTDDTVALQAAATYLRNFAVTDPPLMRPVILSGQGGIYKVTGSLNFTSITLGRGWGLEDVNIVGACAGKIVLDFTDSRFGDLRRVRVWGDIANQPAEAIFLGRSTTVNSVCSNFVLDKVTTDGYFTLAALHVNCAEENSFRDCVFDNRRAPDGGGEAWAAILDGGGFKVAPSVYATPNNTRQSFTINRFTRCSFRKPFGTAGPTMFWQDIASISFDSCYLTNGSGSGVVWRLTSFVPYRVECDFQIETTGVNRFVFFQGDGTVTNPEIRGLRCTFGNMFVDTEVFGGDGATFTTIALKALKMHVYRWQTAISGKVFSNAAKFNVYAADIVVPAFADMNTNTSFAAFSGTVVGMDGTKSTY